MRSLQLALHHASSDHERLVYEGWILYDTGHCGEGLRKAEESIQIKRSFEAFFLKAYALADSSQDPSCYATVVSLLEDALECPSDRLRKGQVWIFSYHFLTLKAVCCHLPFKYVFFIIALLCFFSSLSIFNVSNSSFLNSSTSRYSSSLRAFYFYVLFICKKRWRL